MVYALQPNDPYNAYYLFKIQEGKKGATAVVTTAGENMKTMTNSLGGT